ncbi:MAG: ABC transporter ATP-binding protein [Candidatus Saccharimonadales bacterium]
MSDKSVVVRVQNLTKTFRIPIEASSGIKQKLVNLLQGRKGYRNFTPLDNISFEIEEGDFFGIVGRNGSGKSTLLKTIAGIYTPNSGSVDVAGSLVPFIELGVGFNPELTGRENVFLNGALLGFSRQEMENMYEGIVNFAELHDFMDERLKNYSSGMQVRLAFSIAIRARGDILLLDEVLAVGDEAFQQKCFDYFRELKEKRHTVILVTHDMGAVKQYCNKALLIDDSRVLYVGDPFEAASRYSMLMFSRDSGDISSQPIIVSSIKDHHRSKPHYTPKDTLDLDIVLESNTDLPFRCAYSIMRDGVIITEANSGNESILVAEPRGRHRLRLKVDISDFNSGNYSLNLSFDDTHSMRMVAYRFRAYNFIISSSNGKYGGFFKADSRWEFLDDKDKTN